MTNIKNNIINLINKNEELKPLKIKILKAFIKFFSAEKNTFGINWKKQVPEIIELKGVLMQAFVHHFTFEYEFADWLKEVLAEIK